MSARNDGGPAFPSSYVWENDGDLNETAPDGSVVPPGRSTTINDPGMSVRDKFAESALVGLLAEPMSNGMRSAVCVITGRTSEAGTDTADHYAEAAYALADAMLRKRARSAS